MLELAFSAQDVAQTRLAFSVVGEAVTSVRVLKDPSFHALHLPWISEVRRLLRATPTEHFDLLWDLVPADGGAIPDFATPPPFTPTPELADELEHLTSIPVDQVRADLERSGHRDSPRLRALHADPGKGLQHLAEAIESYWLVALEPHWPRLRALLEADILHRARRIADGGARALFEDLHPAVSWQGDSLHVAHRPYSHQRSAQGRGLLLVPSAYVWPTVFTLTAPPWQPTLIYPARGVATLWQGGTPDAPGGLARVLGRSRARLLIELAAPATTTELARRTGLTTGGVSQHLSALRAAGLVVGSRAGRYILYSRSAAADQMVSAATAARPDTG